MLLAEQGRERGRYISGFRSCCWWQENKCFYKVLLMLLDARKRGRICHVCPEWTEELKREEKEKKVAKKKIHSPLPSPEPD
jgi:hypothetical protein